MKEFISLMYHAVYDGDEELAAIPKEERPYALSAQMFREQIQLLRESGLPVRAHYDEFASEGHERGIQITFDDGDRGWLRHALPVLQEHGFKALFFVTPNLIENRDDFCSWDEIRTLSDAGMTMQSHGLSHKFMSDLSETDCREEFKLSRSKIEDVTGKPVTMISFPGGRFGQDTVEIGVEEGYRHFYTSEVGVNTVQGPAGDRESIKRIAIRHNTSITEFERLIRNEGNILSRQATAARMKGLVKRILGNNNYDRLYRLLKG